MNFCKSACDGTLPKILLTDGLVPFNFIRFIVLTDYDYIEKAFRKRELSSRLYASSKSRIFYFVNARESGLFEYVNDIGLKTGNTKKAIESNFSFIGRSRNTILKMTKTSCQYFDNNLVFLPLSVRRL